MSLFQARDWWSTWCGNDEEFDSGCLAVANIDNSSCGTDKIIVGSFHGVLRVFAPKSGGFKAEDLMLETQMQQPILHTVVGRFVSGTENLHLGILHPRKISVYNVAVIQGSVEHGHHYALNLMYEHILERTSANIASGPFGGVKGKDFICVQSMDGMLSFFEQETFTFSRFLPNFLLPGPLAYVRTTDSFVTCSSSRCIESYKYQMLAVASDGRSEHQSLSGKKVTPDWSTNIGEHAVAVKFVNFPSAQPSIMVLGERSLFCLKEDGSIDFTKKFEYNPSSFLPYASVKEGTLNTLVGTYTNSLLVYQNLSLEWAAQLPHVPVALKIGNFQDLKAVIVTLDEFGHLYCSYLGTDPALFVVPHVDSRDVNYEELDKEMKELSSVIKESQATPDVSTIAQKREELTLHAKVPDHLDSIPQTTDMEGEEEEERYPSITVQITMECESSTPIENVTVNCSAHFPITCNRPVIQFPIVGDKSPKTTLDVSFYSIGGSIPPSLTATVTATYFTSSEAPRVAQCRFELPLTLVCRGCAPVKQAVHKLTVDTNKDPVNLAELFPDIVSDTVIPVAALGIQYYGGPTVTLLSSKTSQRYRIQCDLLEGLWLVVHEHVKRLAAHFEKKKEGVPFKPSFSGPLPLNEYFELIDAHFEQRQNQERLRELLAQRAHQFRVIQRRLLTRFKDKTPAPLANLDILLEGTYRQLLALGEASEDTQRTTMHCGNSLSCGTRLINLLIKLWTNMSSKEYEVLQAFLSPVVMDSDDKGWEEATDASITHLLKTCLAKSSKDQNVSIQPLKMAKDTTKLKKHIALMCERLNKGAKLDLNRGAETEKSKPKKTLEPVSESAEDDEDGSTENMSDTSSTISHTTSPPESDYSDSTLSSNPSLPPLNKKGKLPSLKNKLDQRILIADNSTEAAAVADAVARAHVDSTAINGTV